jgi:endonuclease/exonuclease/phosphatase family metal-dependent hydrolase
MAGPDSPQLIRRLRHTLRLFAIACAVGYPVALAAIALAFRFIGERWWVTLAAMYLPRLGFALPLPFIVGLVYCVRVPRRYLVLQAVSLLLIIFPLMGFNPGIGWLTARASGPTLRVMSFNVSFGRPGVASVVEQARAFGADIVVLQDARARLEDELRNGFQGWNLRVDGEFVLATRHRVRDVFIPPDLMYPQGKGGAHYVHYTLETPLGLVDVFNVHPTSPRPGLEEVRGNGLRGEIVSGRLLAGKARGAVEWNASRRVRQVTGIAERANASKNAVIIAGDTNLPGLSWVLGQHLGRYRDAFCLAGAGFGYTFPAHRPWMRIDRILVNDRLRAVEFRTGAATRSDHRSVFAALVPSS